jgi:hypothetical protein
VEIASSLDFLWKQQARKELEEMSEMRRHTNQLLQNLLPLHVAKFFLHCDRKRQDLSFKLSSLNLFITAQAPTSSYRTFFPSMWPSSSSTVIGNKRIFFR